jgi:hypothetical protein
VRYKKYNTARHGCQAFLDARAAPLYHLIAVSR